VTQKRSRDEDALHDGEDDGIKHQKTEEGVELEGDDSPM
jgi:hypothetical protein